MLLPGIGAGGQQRLSDATILLLGCGALGSVAADILARAGVGHLVIVDRDIVDGSITVVEARFVIGEVVEGWNEALQLMKPGARWMLYIPSDLAYGEQAPPQIGPNRALVFNVELLDVMRGPEPQASN